MSPNRIVLRGREQPRDFRRPPARRAGVLLSQDDALVYLRCLTELMGCEVINVS